VTQCLGLGLGRQGLGLALGLRSQGLGLVSQGLSLGLGLVFQGLGLGDKGLDNITAYRHLPTFVIKGPSNSSIIGKIL